MQVLREEIREQGRGVGPRQRVSVLLGFATLMIVLATCGRPTSAVVSPSVTAIAETTKAEPSPTETLGANFVSSLIAGVVSGSVISAIVGLLFQRRTTKIEEEIKAQYESSLDIFRSRRSWKEQAVSELLGPVYMQLARTKSAFARWHKQDFYLEAKVVGEGNRTIRDLLLEKGHLIPPNLLNDASKLVEHYDIWLEMYESKRLAENPDLETKFIFAGPAGYPFPGLSAQKFREAFRGFWSELYGDTIDESAS